MGRYILRFLGVDYLAEVWLNGTRLGAHEGAEDPFEFDVTTLIRTGEQNRLAVRVLNPTHEPIDGITLNETARGAKAYPIGVNSGTCLTAFAVWPDLRTEHPRA